MRKNALTRMARALEARKQAEQTALAALEARRKAALRKAAAHRASGARGVPEPDASDLRALAIWQKHTDRMAKDSDASAALAAAQMRPVKARLAKTVGRASVVDTLLEREAAEAARRQAMREELAQLAYSSVSPRRGASSAGTE